MCTFNLNIVTQQIYPEGTFGAGHDTPDDSDMQRMWHLPLRQARLHERVWHITSDSCVRRAILEGSMGAQASKSAKRSPLKNKRLSKGQVKQEFSTWAERKNIPGSGNHMGKGIQAG